MLNIHCGDPYKSISNYLINEQLCDPGNRFDTITVMKELFGRLDEQGYLTLKEFEDEIYKAKFGEDHQVFGDSWFEYDSIVWGS